MGSYQPLEKPTRTSHAAISELSQVLDARCFNIVVDYEKCADNYLVDVDGKVYLDTYSQIASIAVGYNNARLRQCAMSPEMISSIVNRPATGNFPRSDYAEILQRGILKVSPPGLERVFMTLCGSDANESAYKAAFIHYRRRPAWTTQEVESCMENRSPGSPELAILSFDNSFHGRLFGSLSTTRSKAIHKMDIPAFSWPKVPFPQLLYPLSKHKDENSEEEKRCLQNVDAVLKSWHCPIAAVVVEPIQSEGGDNHASDFFFRSLQKIVKDNKALFIVDEVQTGVGATGKFWAHEAWNLPAPPDMVTFSKKFQAAGYYFGNPELIPETPYRLFNTWLGDPARAILAGAIVEEIEARALLKNVNEVGKYLMDELEDLAQRFPKHIQNLRGRGLMIAWDEETGVVRDCFIKEMKAQGIIIGGCGVRAVRLRPMLIFDKSHADVLISGIERVINNMIKS